MNTQIHNNYKEQFNRLKGLIIETNTRAVNNPDDEYITSSINFFTKSFLVMSCAYLEAYLKDVALAIVTEVNKALDENPISANLIQWSVLKEKFKETKEFCDFKLSIDAKIIDNEISGNVAKTLSLFSRLGINLLNSYEFNENKDIISGIVLKRNDVVHHNDEVGDLSFLDIVGRIDYLLLYIKAIDDEIVSKYRQLGLSDGE